MRDFSFNTQKEVLDLGALTFRLSFASMPNMSLQARAQMMMEIMTSKNEGAFSHT